MIRPPYAFGRYGSDVNAARMLELRQQIDDLSRQAVTGQKSETYSGLGSAAGTSLNLRSRLSAIDGYRATIQDLKLNLDLMDKSLSEISNAAAKQSSEMTGGFDGLTNGQTTAQNNAMTRLGNALGLLNQDAAGRYLFGGRAAETAPVASLSLIMDGDGARAGLKTLIAERVAADQGSPVTGRLTLTGPVSGGATFSIAEQTGSGPFGLKIASVAGALGGAAIQQPPATPGSVALDFSAGALPADGEALTINFTLPDGSTSSLVLTARTTPSTTPGSTDFQIGATAAETAANAFSVVQAAVATIAGTSLPAASSIAAAQDFFAASPSNPPRRVSGTPPSALAAGTAANTVIWYTGDTSADPRGSALARIDDASVVKVGAQANETPIAKVLAGLGALAGQTLSASDPLSKQRYAVLCDKARSNLDAAKGPGASIESIRAELGFSLGEAGAADKRHQATKGTFETSIADIEGVTKEEVVAQLMAAQNALEASYRVTASISKLKLSDYI